MQVTALPSVYLFGMKLMNGATPSGPRWQWRVRVTVYEAIVRKRVAWGRRYAAFLAGQLRRLEAAFGPLERPPAPKIAQQAATIRAVGMIVRAHPTWTVREVAEVLGISTGTAHRYVAAARRRGL